MPDIVWSEVSDPVKQQIQGSVLTDPTKGNPNIPATGPAARKTALDPTLLNSPGTAGGKITLAVNEVLKVATRGDGAALNFDARFSNIVGNESANPTDWEALQQVGENLTKAVLNVNNVVQNMEFGTMTIAELEVTLNPVYVVRCNFWSDTEQTVPFEFGTFSLDGTTFAGQEQNFEITGVAPGPYIVQFGHVDGYVDPLQQDITVDSSTTIDCIYTRI